MPQLWVLRAGEAHGGRVRTGAAVIWYWRAEKESSWKDCGIAWLLLGCGAFQKVSERLELINHQ